MHEHFFHPADEKVMALIKRATPDQAYKKTFEMLEERSEAGKTGQNYSRSPE